MTVMHTVDTDNFALSGGFAPIANTQVTRNDVPSDKDLVLLAAKSRAARDQYVASAIGGAIKALATMVLDWHQKRVSRKALAGLDARLLRDIGLDSADVQRAIYGAGPGRLTNAVKAVGGYFGKWNQARLTRSALLSLNDAMLSDIGMTRYDVDMLAQDIRAGRWPANKTAKPARPTVGPAPLENVTMGKPVNNNHVHSWFIAPRKAA